MAVKCILTGQEKVNLSGDTMTGDLKVGSSSIGTNGYIEGTWLKTTKAGDKTGDFATIDGEGWIYKRTPAETLGDIGAQPKITANGVLKGDGAGNITAADETEVELVDLPQEIFWATYQNTTFSSIKEAYDANKIVKVDINGLIFDLNFIATELCSFINIANNRGDLTQYFVSDGNGWGELSSGGRILDTKTSILLSTTSWMGSDPYTQTVTIPNSTYNLKVDIQPSEELYDQLVADNVGYLAIKNVDGTLTAVAKGGKPSVDLTVQATYNNVY